MNVKMTWTDEMIVEAATALITAHGDRASQHMIDITQGEIRIGGNCDDIPHDEIMHEIQAQLDRADQRKSRQFLISNDYGKPEEG